jgi:uncharacterized short protein YbdD (DUF466 family)
VSAELTTAGRRRARSLAALRERVRRAGRVLRTIIGAPDYDRYVAHMRSSHPGCAVLSRDEFSRQRLDARYSRPGNRCC